MYIGKEFFLIKNIRISYIYWIFLKLCNIYEFIFNIDYFLIYE